MEGFRFLRCRPRRFRSGAFGTRDPPPTPLQRLGNNDDVGRDVRQIFSLNPFTNTLNVYGWCIFISIVFSPLSVKHGRRFSRLVVVYFVRHFL